MNESDRSEEVEMDRLKQEKSGRKQKIDQQKLKSIVQGNEKKLMKINHRSWEVKFDCLV
jgi:hypothetical protein